MSFFYNLNKTLDGIANKAEPQQINERALGKPNNATTGFAAVAAKAAKEYGSKAAGERVAGAQFQKMKKAGQLEEGNDYDEIRDKIQWLMGAPNYLSRDEASETVYYNEDPAIWKGTEWEVDLDEGVDKVAFAALAPPKNKITFADKIAGAKKEVDEMLGDVAAEAMKNALSGGQKKLDKNQNGKLDAMDFEILRKGAGKQSMGETQGATTYTVAYKDPSKPGKSYSTQVKATSAAQAKAAFQEWDTTNRFTYLGSRPDVDTVYETDRENAFTAHKRPRAETPKVGTITHGRKHDVEEIPGGRRVTRRVDPSGISVGADDEAAQSGEKRGRGRPKGPAKAPERVTGGATRHKGGRKMTKEGDIEITDQGEYDQEGDMAKDSIKTVVRHAQALEKILGDNDNLPEWVQSKLAKIESMMTAVDDYMQNQQDDDMDGEEPIAEKAVSKKQQRFMGMVHAAQKGEKPASGAVAKTAKSMGKKDAEDFASTKHKGLPEKKKSEAKDKKEESAEDKPSKSSSKFKFGGSVYENLDTQLETLINESMNISVNMATADNGQDDHSITVTASGDDAMTLAQLLKSAGLTQSSHEGCSACGQSECGCEQMDENSPDWPTNTETSDNALQYSGGLNKPKSTGQTTTPVLASQLRRQVSMEESVKIERNLFDLYKNFTK